MAVVLKADEFQPCPSLFLPARARGRVAQAEGWTRTCAMGCEAGGASGSVCSEISAVASRCVPMFIHM